MSAIQHQPATVNQTFRSVKLHQVSIDKLQESLVSAFTRNDSVSMMWEHCSYSISLLYLLRLRKNMLEQHVIKRKLPFVDSRMGIIDEYMNIYNKVKYFKDLRIQTFANPDQKVLFDPTTDLCDPFRLLATKKFADIINECWTIIDKLNDFPPDIPLVSEPKEEEILGKREYEDEMDDFFLQPIPPEPCLEPLFWGNPAPK